MKTLSLRVVICLTTGFPFHAYADGCEYDTQCKGDRICENKICVSPLPANHTSTMAAPAAKPAEHSPGLLGVFSKSPTPATDTTYFCCTTSGRLGPFPNPESDGKTYSVGEVCSGTSTSARHFSGRVCN
jgi:hypothetical protein